MPAPTTHIPSQLLLLTFNKKISQQEKFIFSYRTELLLRPSYFLILNLREEITFSD